MSEATKYYIKEVAKSIGGAKVASYLCVTVVLYSLYSLQPYFFSRLLSDSAMNLGYLAGVAASLLSIPLVNYPNNWMLQAVRMHSKRVVWAANQTKDYAYFLNRSVGEYQNLMNEISFAIRSLQYDGLQFLLQSLIIIVVYAVLLFRYHWLVGFLYLLTYGSYLYLSIRLSRQNETGIRRVLDTTSDLNSFMIDFFKNISTILSAGSISLENRNFDKLLNKEREAYFNQQKQIDHSHLITQLWMTLGTVAVVAAGFTLRPGGSFDASLVLILIYSAFHLAGFGKRFLAFLELLGRLDVALRKIGYGDPPRVRPVQVVSLPDPVIIAVEDVSFSYKEGEPVLQQVSFDIRQREKLLIVGKNGSGKSTLVKLIAGLLNPDQGRVLYNRKYLHGAADIGYYSQHMELFDRSIYENMIYPRESCDIGAIWKLVDLLKLNTLIEDEEDLFHKRPGDFGARFSGGEKQKLLIARSLMNKKPVMIYDEVNSALDREAVEIFANLIENELRNSTVILVSHRIEGICGFERVVEISDGRLSLVS
ncbi:MAG: hypothetical protein DIU76_11970 [Bacillota bacterium]|nr:MAG: hypothetical protein DIU76_11970 [Bacillota bacterium]